MDRDYTNDETTERAYMYAFCRTHQHLHDYEPTGVGAKTPHDGKFWSGSTQYLAEFKKRNKDHWYPTMLNRSKLDNLRSLGKEVGMDVIFFDVCDRTRMVNVFNFSTTEPAKEDKKYRWFDKAWKQWREKHVVWFNASQRIDQYSLDQLKQDYRTKLAIERNQQPISKGE